MIRVTLVLIAGLVLGACLRRRPAALRHRVLAAAIALAAAMPFTQSLVPAWQLPVLPAGTAFSAQPIILGEVDGALAGRPQEASHPPGRSLKVRALASLPLVWAAGAGVSLLLLGMGLVRATRVAARARPIEDERWTRAARGVAGRLGLARAPVLLRADHDAMLFTWGIRRPTVVLPRDAIAWTEQRIAIVLGHELAHVGRGDWAVQLLALCVRCVYWFDPLAWIVCSRLRLESEQACDDEVLRHGVAAPDYASELLALASLFKQGRRSLLPAPAMARHSELERRVRTMLDARLNRAPVRRSSVLLVWAGMLALTLPVAGVSLAPGPLPVQLEQPASLSATPAAPAGGIAAVPPRRQSGSLTGTVADQTGKPIPNLPVTLIDAATSVKVQAATGQDGRFEMSNLAPGLYELRVSKPGFKPSAINVEIKAGASVSQDVVLQLGTLSETITVSVLAGATMVPTTPRARHAAPPPVTDPCAGSSEGGCLTPPLKLADAKPIYPAHHAQAGVSGEVRIFAVVRPDGTVGELQPEPDAEPDFAAAAMRAIRLWQFSPTRLNGEPIEVAMTVKVTFQAVK